MKTEELNGMIDLYFDGELEKSKESILFSLLSQDEGAREYFKQLNALKSNISFTMEEFPSELEKKILYSIANKSKTASFFTGGRIFAFATYALTIILIVLSAFLYTQSKNYQNTIEAVSQQIIKQNQVIQILMNSLPATEISPTYANTVVVKANL